MINVFVDHTQKMYVVWQDGHCNYWFTTSNNWQNGTQIIKKKNSYGIEGDTMKIERILCEIQ